MKVYQCDSCGRIIENLHEERMKEFYISASCCDGIFAIPHNDKRRVKIHLCDDCFRGLHKIAENALKEQKK